jgi:DHA2 family methylenomycin A resistance protein-like MFS transporter
MSSAPASSPTRAALAVGLGCVVNPLNGTMVAVALADMAVAFDLAIADATWLVTLFLALTAACQPVAGALGDRLGRRRVYLAGLGLFLAASVAAALAPTFAVLVLCRCVQGIGSAVIIPNGQALLRDAVEETQRGRAIGVMQAVMGVGASVGLPLGAWLSATLGWQSVFLVNLPIGVLGLVAALRVLPAPERSATPVSALAVVGSVLIPLTIAGELLRRHGLSSRVVVWGAAVLATCVAVAVVVGRSRRARTELRAIASRTFVVASAIILLIWTCFYASLLLLPSWLSATLDIPRQHAGLYLALMSLAMVAVVPLAGMAADRSGSRRPTLVGVVLSMLALALLGWSPVRPGVVVVVSGLLLLGAGAGSCMPPVMRAVLNAAPPRSVAQAMGLFNTSRLLGGIVGTLIMAATAGAASQVAPEMGQATFRGVILVALLPAAALALLLPGRNAAPPVMR